MSHSINTVPCEGTAAKPAAAVSNGLSNLPTNAVASFHAPGTIRTSVGAIGAPKTPDNCDKPTETTELSTCDHILNESEAHSLPDQAA